MHSADQVSGKAVSVGTVKPATVAQCHEVIQAQAQQIEWLLQRVAHQDEQMALLQERLKLDSHNSSKPPSSDGPGSPNRAARRASGRKRGAQKGHPGAYRALLPEAEVNGVQDCWPAPLCECGAAVAGQGKPVRHQVFDIPPVAADVQEYRLYSGTCRSCGNPHRAALPAGVHSGQIGPRALGLGLVLFRWREQGKTAAQFEALQRRVHTALIQGVEQTGCKRTQATCQNLLKLWPALWSFVGNPAVRPTNNKAERSIRAIVLKRKISGPTRSKRGDALIARGFSVVETCRRQGRDLIGYMHQAIIAWIDKAPHPSLLPAPSG